MEIPVVAVLLLAGAALVAAHELHAHTDKFTFVEGCGSGDRWCLTKPDGCSGSKQCELVATVRKDPSATDKYLFELSAVYSGYVAIALAESEKMGNDSVVECVNFGNEVKVFQSVNHYYPSVPSDQHPRGNKRLPDSEQKGVTLVSQSFKDGVISCSFQRDQKTTVDGKEYDLGAGQWVLQVAAGDTIDNATHTLRHHDSWKHSNGKIKISSPAGLVISGASASVAALTTLAVGLLACYVL